MNVKGLGAVVVNNVNTHTGAWTVNDTATLAINAGKKATTGAVTIGANATLALPESGTVALDGALTLKDGATLAFNFTERAVAPVLDVSSATAGGTIKVAVGGAWPKGGIAGKAVLTSGGAFAGASVSLADGCPRWAKSVAVEDGNIVLTFKPMAVMVLVR